MIRSVDQEVEAWPDVAQSPEVLEALEEGAAVSATMIRSRSLRSSAFPRATEPKAITVRARRTCGAM
jgi:hypothetical protein